MEHLRGICAEVAAFGIVKRWQKLKALARMRPGRPLMLDYYFHPGLRRWVDATLAQAHMDIVYIYSTAMAPYALHLDRPGKILDMQDIRTPRNGRSTRVNPAGRCVPSGSGRHEHCWITSAVRRWAVMQHFS